MEPISSARAATSTGASTSGAPNTQSPRAPKETPDHFLAEVNGARAVTSHGEEAAGVASAIADIDALGAGSAATSWASTSVTSSASPSRGITSPRVMAFWVRVPVLSAHTTLTRARPSMAGSSCTRHLRRPSRITPSAKAIEVSSTRPSGIIGTRAPTIRRADSCQVVPGWRNCTQMVSNPAGISNQVTNFRMRSMPARNSELTSVNLAACAVSCAA